MRFPPSIRSVIYGGPVFFLAVLAASTLAVASDFAVSPTQLFLGTNTSTQLIVTNASRDPVTLSVTGYSWTDGLAGQPLLKTSDGIIVFPGIFTLLPLQQQILRVGVTAPSRANELTYRIVVSELPPPQILANKRGASIRVLTAFSVPVFLSPLAARTDITLANPRIANGKFQFEIANVGSIHIPPTSAKVIARDAEGRTLWTHSASVWYVLAGDRRNVSVTIPAASCASARSFSVRLDGQEFHANRTFDAISGSCRS